jgi:hypothetical protein
MQGIFMIIFEIWGQPPEWRSENVFHGGILLEAEVWD